jgi:hypothetical protein
MMDWKKQGQKEEKTQECRGKTYNNDLKPHLIECI